MSPQTPWLKTALTIAIGTVVVGLVGLLVWLVVRWVQRPDAPVPMEQVTLTTTDGVIIAGDLYRPETAPRGGAVLVHMLAGTKDDWAGLASELAGQGILVLAIDLRGHGASQQRDGVTLNYQNFSDAEHQESSHDVQAAIDWLASQESLRLDQLMLIGAGIGANLSLQALADNPTLAGAALISPGLDYRGIVAEQFIQRIAPPQRLYLAAGRQDFYAIETIRRLSALAPVPLTTNEIDAAGHGTVLLANHPDLQQQIVRWVTTITP